MEILEAFDLTGGLRAAAQLAGCDHKTVAHYVALRDVGISPDERERRARRWAPGRRWIRVLRAGRSGQHHLADVSVC